MNTGRFRFHCTVCGRFVPWDADCGTPFGRVTDIEPPDPERFCDQCAQEWKQKAIEGDAWLLTTWYVRPRWATEAALVIDEARA